MIEVMGIGWFTTTDVLTMDSVPFRPYQPKFFASLLVFRFTSNLGCGRGLGFWDTGGERLPAAVRVDRHDRGGCHNGIWGMGTRADDTEGGFRVDLPDSLR